MFYHCWQKILIKNNKFALSAAVGRKSGNLILQIHSPSGKSLFSNIALFFIDKLKATIIAVLFQFSKGAGELRAVRVNACALLVRVARAARSMST